jgi:hypothetical protein
MERNEVLDLVKAVTQWIASPEGHQALNDTVERSEQVTNQLEDSRRIDEQSLNNPFTL